MTLDEYLDPRRMEPSEGHIGQVPEQKRDLTRYVTQPEVRKILEIGFNAGHSSELFLRENTAAHVTSFDLGEHRYVQTAKEYLDRRFRRRHVLVLGDSTQTVPGFESNYLFDLIFIDGGHSYEVAKADLSTVGRWRIRKRLSSSTTPSTLRCSCRTSTSVRRELGKRCCLRD